MSLFDKARVPIAAAAADGWGDVREGTEVVDRLMVSGGELTEVRLHYRTLGTLRRDASGAPLNAAMLLHGTGGSGEQFLQPGFTDAMFGQDQPLDLRRWCVLIPDGLGHGKSSKPSDGLYADFPAYGYSDMVNAQQLLLERLGLSTLRLILGISMGGMQTWMWAGQHPHRMQAAVAIACEPAPITGRNLWWRRLITRAIRNDPDWRAGRFSPPPRGYQATWPMFPLMTSTPRRLAEFSDPGQVIQTLDAMAAAAPDATDVLYALEASTDYDPRPLLAEIRAPLLAINFADDETNPPELHLLEAALPDAPTASAVLIPASEHTEGHQSLNHANLYAHHISAFLDQHDQPGAARV